MRKIEHLHRRGSTMGADSHELLSIICSLAIVRIMYILSTYWRFKIPQHKAF